MLYIPFQDIEMRDFWSKLRLIGYFRKIIYEFNCMMKEWDLDHHFG